MGPKFLLLLIKSQQQSFRPTKGGNGDGARSQQKLVMAQKYSYMPCETPLSSWKHIPQFICFSVPTYMLSLPSLMFSWSCVQLCFSPLSAHFCHLPCCYLKHPTHKCNSLSLLLTHNVHTDKFMVNQKKAILKCKKN